MILLPYTHPPIGRAVEISQDPYGAWSSLRSVVDLIPADAKAQVLHN
jgi:hypothetical protein